MYLDFQATTPLDPRVLDAMLPFETHQYGNAHSRTHSFGWEAESAVEEARENIADLVGADPREIVFTSGATESNNIALKGAARFYGMPFEKDPQVLKRAKRHIITTVTEHKCVLESCLALKQEGFDITFLPVEQNGIVSMEKLKAAIRPDTLMVSVMAVNNEIGVVQPLKEIGEFCRSNKILFHTDAAQAVGKIPVDVNDLNIDLMSISGHKLYGPKGIGAIYVRRRPRVRLEAVQSGGRQERGIRSGTLPTQLCVGLGAACKVAKEEMHNDSVWIKKLYDRMYSGIVESVPHVQLNGDAVQRYYGNLNISFAFVEGESLLMALKNAALSSGSACTSASLEPSYVLRALGVDEEMAHTSIRFGIGRFTTEEEADAIVDLCKQNVGRLREMSPLWEMVQEGIDLKTIQWTQDH